LANQQGNVLVLSSPSRHRRSCGSVTGIENNENCYRIDDLKQSKQCRLVTPMLGIPRTIAHGLGKPLVEGSLFNTQLIPKGYAVVHLDNVKDGHHRSKLEFPREKGEYNLRKNVGCYVLWCKHDIDQVW
jgi:hypothetical protein